MNIHSITDGEKGLLSRAAVNPAELKILVERYQKLLFGFALSFASFSREQAFDISSASLVHALQLKRQVLRDGEFLEEIFRETIRKCLEEVPTGSPDLTAFGDLSSHSKEFLKIVRQALVTLSAQDKCVLLLRDQCHFTFAGIAPILDMEISKARLFCLEARERLRTAVQNILERKTG